MDHMLPCLLLLSGLLSLSLGIQQEYILIKQSMTWEDAQNYCRTHHIDLATVQSSENWTRLEEAANEKQFSSYAWIGLYNDINSWHWSYNEESLVFKNWASGQPDNYGAGEECVSIYSEGKWFDYYCTTANYFVCYDGSPNATEKLVFIKTLKTWTDAQDYCRRRYTDLPIIRSQEDNDEIQKLIYSWAYPVWIGLYRDSWKWSDQSNVTSSVELATQNLNGWNENCAGENPYRTFDDASCTATYYFFCQTVKRNRQVIRVQVKAAENVNEERLKALVLNKLKQTLSDEDVTMTWKTQRNGKVFQKMMTVWKSSDANTTAAPLVC